MRSLLPALAAAVLLVGCSDDDTPTQPTPTLALAASANTATVSAGGAASSAITLTVTRSAGLTGAVTLAAEGVPTGVTATFTPQQIPDGSTTSSLVLTAVTSAPVGSTPIVIRASSGSAQSVTQTVTLNVTAAAVSGASFTTTPDSLAVRQGENGTVGVRITRSAGFTGPVAFAIDTLPTGVTATFAPVSPISADSTVLTLGVGASVPAGTYPLRLRSTVAGQADSTRTIRLTVVATGSIALTATPTALTLAPGDSAVATVVLRRTAPFTGAVSIASDTVSPAGLTVRVSPTSLAAGADTARVTIIAAANADTATVRTVFINARATGVPSASATIAVTIRRPATIGFTLGADSLSTLQGGVAQTQLRITRTGGFTGPVTFAVDSLPTGVTSFLLPASPVAGDSTTLSLNAAASVAPGTYNIPIRATGTGVSSVSRVLRLIVRATGSVAVSIVPDSLSITAGDTTTATVRIVRTAPFAGVVRLALDSLLPAGVTVTLSADSLLASQDSARINIVTTDSMSASGISIGVTASGAGVQSVRDSVTVSVAQASGFRLGLSPDTLTVEQGRGSVLTVDAPRSGGFMGSIIISTGTLPPLVTATNFGTPIMGTTPGRILFSVGAGVPVGNYPVTITGTSAGATTRTASFILRVVAP